MIITKKFLAALFSGFLLIGTLGACSDEDGDGATTDEEVDEVGESTEDLGDELEQEIDEGNKELEDEG